MLYLNEKDMLTMGINWEETVDVIEEAVKTCGDKDYAQPIKPYLRYREPKNRIIAMPAFIGGETNMAGIKWIASFPDNIYKGIPRANSVVVLNNADTGVVEGIINTPMTSIIRTASVTGLMIRYFEKARELKDINVGIIGFGPIGQHHLKMCHALLGDKVANYYLYDKRDIIDAEKLKNELGKNVMVTKSWEETYENADIFMTCTVAEQPYINKKPKEGALVLNVSLRDFKDEVYPYVKDCLIVDDWEEVCREGTTIEDWNKHFGLQKEDTHTMVDVVVNNQFSKYSKESNIMFNPMGMAIFDVAISTYYYRKALKENIGHMG